ncbi:MAG: hypothetical protein ACI4KF_07940 [Huintestinicola sp.]
MEQLSFISPALPTDMVLLKEQLSEMISRICINQKVDRKYMMLEERCTTKDGISIPIGYSVWILEPKTLKKSDRVFSIVPKNSQKINRFEVELKYDRRNWFAIPNNFIEKISEIKNKEGGKVYTTKKYSLYIPLDSTEIYKFLYQWTEKALKEFTPSERFGCCAKYKECSNSKKCLHKNNFYARCCYYRQNIEAGKIFYGVNKNI